MDVRCDKCGREYLFDDAKVTEAGVVVRCTRCGNTFRLRRRALITTEPMGSADASSTLEDGRGHAGPEGFRKSDFNLASLPRVQEYRGFVFASLSATGLSFEDQIGPAVNNLWDHIHEAL